MINKKHFNLKSNWKVRTLMPNRKLGNIILLEHVVTVDQPHSDIVLVAKFIHSFITSSHVGKRKVIPGKLHSFDCAKIHRYGRLRRNNKVPNLKTTQ